MKTSGLTVIVMSYVYHLRPAALLLAAILFGCQPTHRGGTSSFPQTMVGIWASQENDHNSSRWVIKIENDGSVRRIEHYMAGRVDLDAGGVEFTGRDDSSFLFVFDKTKADFNAVENMVSIKISVPYYRMEMPAGTLEGNLEDIFEGPVSVDGKVWKAYWINRGQLDGAVHVSDELTERYKKEIVFHKREFEN